MENWRGNVKARHFALALRDYYVEKHMSETKGVTVLDHDTGSQIDTSSQIDAWAIRFIDVIWLQPILEAFDDDASGFITITEVNTFTDALPDGWRSVSRCSK